MGYRLSKIVTKTGDKGDTNLSQQVRVPKNHILVEAIGTCDELNAHIGLLMAYLTTESAKILEELTIIQHALFNLGAELVMPEYNKITEDSIKTLEEWLSLHNEKLPPLTEFILPSGGIAVSEAHIARTVARRLERIIISAHQETELSPFILQFVNRLSDYLFIISRSIARTENNKEVYWNNKAL